MFCAAAGAGSYHKGSEDTQQSLIYPLENIMYSTLDTQLVKHNERLIKLIVKGHANVEVNMLQGSQLVHTKQCTVHHSSRMLFLHFR